LVVTDQALALGATAYPVSLCLLDTRRVRLDTDTHVKSKVETLFVCQA
jgi:hypothetical protein